MKILILCSGKAAMTWEERYDSAGFERAVSLEADCDIQPAEVKTIQADGRPVYVSSLNTARSTARFLLPGAEPIREPLLDEVPRRACKDSEKPLPLGYWQRMARLQRAMGVGRQPETNAQAKGRAERLIALLEERGKDCILVSHPIFIQILLDRFRAHGYVAARSEIFRVKPLERILITRRDMHCGGCSHNCLLTNPGCNVGKDKARRNAG